MKIFKFIFVFSLVALTIAACTPSATPSPLPTSITIQLSWTHQAQLAGMDAAEQALFQANHQERNCVIIFYDRLKNGGDKNDE